MRVFPRTQCSALAWAGNEGWDTMATKVTKFVNQNFGVDYPMLTEWLMLNKDL